MIVADEGGIAGRLPSNADAVALVVDGIHHAGLEPGSDVGRALDVAATNFQNPDGDYSWASEGRPLTSDELVGWSRLYPIISIEGPVGEDDWAGWSDATRRIPVDQLVGDDVFVTNVERLRRGIEGRLANSILVKPNQNGTLSGTRAILEMARAAGYTTVVSARSGETEDAWLSDLTVG